MYYASFYILVYSFLIIIFITYVLDASIAKPENSNADINFLDLHGPKYAYKIKNQDKELNYKSVDVKYNDDLLDASYRSNLYPHFTKNIDRGILFDFKKFQPITLIEINDKGLNAYELLDDNSFRFRMKCNEPFVDHTDIPWHCFKNPCGAFSVYNVGEKKCICMEGFENEFIGKANSKCIRKGYREYYNQNTEILTIRSRCSQILSLTDNKNKFFYPCEESDKNNYSLQGILLRFLNEKLSIENHIKLFDSNRLLRS